MNHGELLASLKQGRVAPIYLLTGEEAFLRDEAMAAVIESLLQPGGRDFNLRVFHADDADPAEIANVAASYPVLSATRVVVIKAVEKLTEAALQVIIPSVLPRNDTTCLVLVGSGVDSRRKSWKLLKEHAVAVDYKPVYDSKLPEWISRCVSGKGGSISVSGARLLGEAVGNRLGELSMEIDKLLLACEGKAISAADVQESVGAARAGTVFKLVDQILARNLGKAFDVSQELLRRGESGVGIVAALARHYAILVRLRSMVKPSFRPQEAEAQALAGKVGIPRYFLEKYIDQMSSFSEVALNEGVSQLLDADDALKSGYQTERLVIDLLVLGLCRGTKT